MIRTFCLLFLAAIVAAAVPGAAFAQEGSTWHRIQNPEGSFSVEMPCTENDVQAQEDGGSFGMACWLDNIVIGAVLTTDGVGAGGPDAASDFEGMLAEARDDPESARVELLPSAGPRMFRVWKDTAGPFGIAQFIELRAGEIIVLAVMEDPEGLATDIDFAATEQLALRYFDSLQALTQ